LLAQVCVLKVSSLDFCLHPTLGFEDGCSYFHPQNPFFVFLLQIKFFLCLFFPSMRALESTAFESSA